MRLLFAALLCVLTASSYAMQANYQAGKQYGQGGVTLGNPNQWDNGFLSRDKDVSHLTNMNDTTLSDQGSEAYRAQSAEVEANDRARSAQAVSDTMLQSGTGAQAKHQALQTEAGNLLTLSEVKKIEAMNEHKIDPSDQFYKDALAIESNPLSKTGGVEVKQKTTVTKETIEHCEDGVKFQVDVVNQLTYVPPPWVPPQDKAFDLTSNRFWRTEPWHGHIYFNLPYTGVLKSIEVILQGAFPHRGGGHTHYWLRIQPFHPGLIDHYHNPRGTFALKFNNLSYNTTANQQAYLWINGREYIQVPDFTVRYKGIIQVPGYRTKEGAKEHWSIITPDTEQLIQQHQCHETKRQCLDAGDKHFDELVVHRPCWKWQVSYACQSEPLDGCRYLQDQGCYLKESTCVDTRIKPCAKYKRTYQCKVQTAVETMRLDNTSVFCLDGNCHTPETAKNTDMNQAIAQLAVFKAMQKQMTQDNPPSVFKGEIAQCVRHMVNFTDCCTALSGWGTSMGLSKCTGEEKALAQRKAKGVCHYVGTYCAEKVKFTGICLRKKSSYCCFPDKLARLLHEQGRPQLGRNWGSAEHPDCGAFSVQELQRLKLDQMDFSEIFADLFKNVGAKAMKAVPRQMQNQMPIAQQNIDRIRQQKNGQSHVQKQVF